MEATMHSRRVESFLLRVVVQDGVCTAPDAWRGRIQHVATGDERHFGDLEEVINFIREQFDSDFSRLTLDIEDRR
jgi:hypothetical protein